MLDLPNHIEQKSEKWFFNTKTGKFIHADHINEFLERYWKNRRPAKKAAISYKKNVKLAKRRWENEI
jgi:hypothetical protein